MSSSRRSLFSISDCKTSVSLYILLNVNVNMLTNIRPFSFRTPCSFYYDPHVFVITNSCTFSFRSPGKISLFFYQKTSLRTPDHMSLRTSCFLLYFVDFFITIFIPNTLSFFLRPRSVTNCFTWSS